jgi:FlaA1/EpsC-like NDP-sugar epimerase
MIIGNFGIWDAARIAGITACLSVIAIVVMLLIPSSVLPHWRISSWFMGAITLMALTIGMRGLKRLVNSAYRVIKKKHASTGYKRTLLVGAGSAAKVVLDDVRLNYTSKSRVVAIVDDDVSKVGRVFSGIPVVDSISNIASVVERYKIEEVIIAIQSLSKDKVNEIIGSLKYSPVEIRRLPILSELNSVNSKTVMSVNLDEILGRNQIILDNSEINTMLHGKNVLVTGAGGSIGSELVRQIYKTRPKTLILFDIYENGVYAIQQEIVREIKRENCQDVKLVTLIGSTYNEIRVEQVMKEYRPDYIYHAAAYKHVPLMEESPVEAVRTNVIGTYNVARLADKYHVKKMLLISTDKAVRPTNAMGATKRFAEMIVQYFASISKNTKYCAVRFGNVLGSNGSVIPLFEKQIEEGGPVTVTDPNIIRFFMTIPEAVSLILQSSLYADGGEIFILDMGKPMKIVTLAEKMIRQAGYTPYTEMPIVFTGLRPGEKLYEETLYNPKDQIKTSNNKIYIEKRGPVQEMSQEVDFMRKSFDLEETPNTVKDLLASVVKTYKPEKND